MRLHPAVWRCRLLAAGYWRPATGGRLLAAGYRPSSADAAADPGSITCDSGPPHTPHLPIRPRRCTNRRKRLRICHADRRPIVAAHAHPAETRRGRLPAPSFSVSRTLSVSPALSYPSYPSCLLGVPLFALRGRHNRWLSGGLCRAVRTIYRSRVFCSLFDLIVVPARISPLCHTSLLFFSLSLPVLPLIAKSSPSYPISPLVTRGRRLFAASPTFSAPRPFLLSTFPLPLGVRCRSQSAALSPVGSRHTRAAPGWKHRHPQLPAVNVANEWCARRRLQGVAGLEMESLCQCGGTYWCCAFLQVSERRLTGLGKISIPLVGSWHLVTSAGRRELLSCRLTSTMFLQSRTSQSVSCSFYITITGFLE